MQPLSRQSLRWPVILIIALSMLASILYWQHVSTINQQLRTEALQQAELRARQLAGSVADQLDLLVRYIDFAAQELIEAKIRNGPPGLDREVAEIANRFPPGSLLQIATIDALGYLSYSNLGSRDVVYLGDREHFLVHARSNEDRLFISKPVQGRVSKQWSIQFSRPIRQNGRFVGVLVISVAPIYLQRALLSLNLGDADSAALLRQSGEYLARKQAHDAAMGQQITVDRGFVGPDAPAQGYYTTPGLLDNELRLHAWQRLASYPLVVVVGLAHQHLLAPIERRIAADRQQAVIGLGTLWLLVLVIVALLLRIGRQYGAEAERTEKLRDDEARLRAIYDVLPVGITLTDRNGRVVDCNQASEQLLGITREDHLARCYNDSRWEILRPDGSPMPADEYAGVRALRDGKPARDVEMVVKTPAGTRWLSVSATPVGYNDYGVAIAYADISSLKAAEQAASHSGRLLAEAVESLPEGFTIYDAEDRLVICNEAFLEFYNTSRDLVVPGARFADIVRGGAERGQCPAAIGRIDEWVSERVQQHQAANGQAIEQQLDDGRWLLIIEYRTPSGYIVGNRIDITARKQIETELARHRKDLETIVAERTLALSIAKEAAEAANRAKSSFLANMSHELRTPMNAIIGLTYILRNKVTDPAHTDKLAKISDSASHLLDLLNDILELSKIDAERMTLDVAPFTLEQVTEKLRSLQSSAALAKQLDLHFEIDRRLAGHQFVGDALRLHQILLNLVSNAVKFTERGGVRLDIHAAGEEAEQPLIEFAVTDTGIGIPASALERIFSPFEQADGSTTRRFGGTGLGLAICQRLVQLMGGEIAVSSTEGIGSRFSFTLRLPAANVPQAAPPAATGSDDSPHISAAGRALRERHRDKHLLLAEDNWVNQEVACELLREALGLRLDVAADGARAVQFATTRPYDLILMDMDMPDVDGINATLAIRQLPGYADVPIIALTANAFAEDRERCFEAGMNDFIAKPVDPDFLYQTVLHWLEPSGR